MTEQTKTIETAYGETSITIVECDSCGAEVAKDDAERFEIGDRSGWACPHCVDDGPVSYPARVKGRYGLPEFAVTVVAFPLVALIGLLDPFIETAVDKSTQKYWTGISMTIWAFVLWAFAATVVWWVVL